MSRPYKIGDIVSTEDFGLCVITGERRHRGYNAYSFDEQEELEFYDDDESALTMYHKCFPVGTKIYNSLTGNNGIVDKVPDADGEYNIRNFSNDGTHYVNFQHISTALREKPFGRDVSGNDFAVATETQKTENLEGGNDMENFGNVLIDELKSLIVEGENSGLALTPSGLSIGGKVFSTKENALLDVNGLELIKDIPFGFILPTEIESIEKGDILFDKDSKPLYVVSKSEKAPYKVTCIDSEDREATLYPVLNLFKGQTFNKLMTPFNYDLGCNPSLNALTFGVASYMSGGKQGIIRDFIPQMIKMSSKIDLNKILKQKGMTTIAPMALIGYKIITSSKIDLKNFKIKEIASKLKIDKKIVGGAILALLLVLYLNKDRVSEYLISNKIKKIPVIGVIAKPIAKVLTLIPTINKKVWKDLFSKLVTDKE